MTSYYNVVLKYNYNDELKSTEPPDVLQRVKITMLQYFNVYKGNPVNDISQNNFFHLLYAYNGYTAMPYNKF